MGIEVYICKYIIYIYIQIERRGRVLSVLLHAAGAWAAFLEGEMKEFASGYLPLCRQLLCISKKEDPKMDRNTNTGDCRLP